MNAFTVLAAKNAASSKNRRFTTQKYFRKKSSMCWSPSGRPVLRPKRNCTGIPTRSKSRAPGRTLQVQGQTFATARVFGGGSPASPAAGRQGGEARQFGKWRTPSSDKPATGSRSKSRKRKRVGGREAQAEHQPVEAPRLVRRPRNPRAHSVTAHRRAHACGSSATSQPRPKARSLHSREDPRGAGGGGTMAGAIVKSFRSAEERRPFERGFAEDS